MHTANRRGVLRLSFGFASLLALTPFRGLTAAGVIAKGDPRKESLYSQFIAPCCWRENLTVHQSPKADELRAEIDQLIAGGRSDHEIRSLFVSRYSKRILSQPEGADAWWLGAMPVAITLAGLGTLGWFLKHSTRKSSQSQQAPAAQLPPHLATALEQEMEKYQ